MEESMQVPEVKKKVGIRNDYRARVLDARQKDFDSLKDKQGYKRPGSYRK